MKTIKSVSIKGNTIKMVAYQQVYYLLYDNLSVSMSPCFDDISSLFDKWILTL